MDIKGPTALYQERYFDIGVSTHTEAELPDQIYQQSFRVQIKPWQLAFSQKLECLHHFYSVITFRIFTVITPKWPGCYAVHATHLSAAESDLRSITWAHGSSSPSSRGERFSWDCAHLGQKGMRGLSGKRAGMDGWAAKRWVRQQEAHLPTDCLPEEQMPGRTDERCQPAAQNSSGAGGREGNIRS